MRRLRHPLGRARRRAARVLRALRAPAPRPGVGRDRRLRRAAGSRCCATWASSPRSSTRRSCRRCPARSRSGTRATRRPARTHWANAQPLVHHGRARTVALGHNGNLTNTDGAPRRARRPTGSRSASTSDTEVIAALIAHDPAPLAARRSPQTMARLEGAYSVVALVRGQARRASATRTASGRSRSAGSAGRLGARVRDLRARPDRRARRARRPSRRGRRDRRGRHLTARRRCRRAGRRSASSSTSTSRGPTRGSAACEVHGVRVRMGERLADGGAGRSRPRDADPRLRHAGRDRLRAGVRDPVQRGPDQEPLRRPHVHPARPGAAPAGDPDEVQPARRGRGQAAS